MADIDISNLGFTKVKDTVYDAKLMEGLANLGVLPHSFQVIKAVLDVSAVTVDDDGVAADGVIAVGEAGRFLDVETNQPVVLGDGQQVVFLAAVATTATVGGGVQIGLAASATAGVTDELAATVAAPYTGGADLTNPGTLVDTNVYLKGEATGSPVTAGVVQVVIIVV